MKYISIDLETTGLWPKEDDILQFGAVYENGGKHVHELPSISIYLCRDRYKGTPKALSMNQVAFDRIVNRPRGHYYVPDYREMLALIKTWLWEIGIREDKFTVAGKNFGGFDQQFLKEKQIYLKHHHRILDPGPMYVTPNDEVPPDLTECCRRAGVKVDGLHDAVSDARMVIQLIRNKLNVT